MITIDNITLALARASNPRGWIVDDNAPSSFAELRSMQARDAMGRLTVWRGGSDHTIFFDAYTNHAFRAWHDATHLRLNAGFDEQGERNVCAVQCAELRQWCAANGVADWQTDHYAALIHADIVGQLEYASHHRGSFPVDQRSFDYAYLANRQHAIHADY